MLPSHSFPIPVRCKKGIGHIYGQCKERGFQNISWGALSYIFIFAIAPFLKIKSSYLAHSAGKVSLHTSPESIPSRQPCAARSHPGRASSGPQEIEFETTQNCNLNLGYFSQLMHASKYTSRNSLLISDEI